MDRVEVEENLWVEGQGDSRSYKAIAQGKN